jgi:hypothetical protein
MTDKTLITLNAAGSNYSHWRKVLLGTYGFKHPLDQLIKPMNTASDDQTEGTETRSAKAAKQLSS